MTRARQDLQSFVFLFLLSSFLLSVLRHIISVYEASTLHSEDDYYLRENGEIPTQVFPNFPILRERAVYTRDCNIQDQKQQKDSCQKDFPSHSKLTPGLYLMTCGCPKKVVYGFSMMLSDESPSMLFDLVMTRFEANYNPHLIYDASCLAKEYDTTGNCEGLCLSPSAPTAFMNTIIHPAQLHSRAPSTVHL